MKKDFALKAELIRKYGTQFNACRRLGIQPSRISALCRGSSEPSKRELNLLTRALGGDFVRRFFKTMDSDRQPERVQAAI